jgi:hypothetical protein
MKKDYTKIDELHKYDFKVEGMSQEELKNLLEEKSLDKNSL